MNTTSLQIKPQLLTVENHSTVVNDHQFANICYANNFFTSYYFGLSPWGVIGHILLLPKGVKPPAGAWNIILMDDSSEAGTLGFHEDEAGTNIPYADIFCKTAREFSVQPCAVVGHEAAEMLVDPNVREPRTVIHGEKVWIVEVCDPVEGNEFDLGLPFGITTGLKLPDFCYPAFYKIEGIAHLGGRINLPETKMSFRESISTPFTLSTEGYQSIASVGSENWEQIYGAHSDKARNRASLEFARRGHGDID